MQLDGFMTQSMRDPRVARILLAAIQGADPAVLVRQSLKSLTLPPHRRRFLLGLGKAAEVMTRAVAEELGNIDGGLVITKQQSGPIVPGLRVLEGGHPIPDRRSLLAGEAALKFASSLDSEDLLICLISGGGSALATAPVNGVSLEDLQALTSAALASGINIEEVNAVRRRLDRLKGGGLAASTKASVLSLILSDVIGDHIEAIASGPTVLDTRSTHEAIRAIRKMGRAVPASIDAALRAPISSTPRHTDRRFVTNVIVGSIRQAVRAAVEQAVHEGFSVEVVDTQLQGEAREVGRTLAARLMAEARVRARPFCMIAGGETTVTMADHGTGGRNQELALATVDALSSTTDCMLVSLATDGNDGPTDAAGAVVTDESKGRASTLGLEPNAYLQRHDSYAFFAALGDLLKIGQTGTNVNDLMVLLGL